MTRTSTVKRVKCPVSGSTVFDAGGLAPQASSCRFAALMEAFLAVRRRFWDIRHVNSVKDYSCVVNVFIFERGEEFVEIFCVLADYGCCSR